MNEVTLQQAFDVALGHHRAGRFQEAESLYRQILAQQPGSAAVMQLLGVLAMQMGHADEAAILFRQTIRLAPDFAEAHGNLGLMLAHQGFVDEAIEHYQRAIAIKPDFADAHYNLGLAWKRKGEYAEAAECFRRVVVINPNYVDAYNDLGTVLQALGKANEAIGHFRSALTLAPSHFGAHNNLGIAQQFVGHLDEAIKSFGEALANNPRYAGAHINLGNALKERGQIDEAIASYRKAMEIEPNSSKAHSNLLYALHFHPECDAATLLHEHRVWCQRFADPLMPGNPSYDNARSAERGLRVGYISADFREHVVAWNLLPLLMAHDHERFEIFCYADVPCPDTLTERVRACADQWRSIVGMNDERVAKMIRDDHVDILVDLSLHTAHHHLLVFARKPAPIQVTYLGYCSTSGMKAMDYRLSDPHLDPSDVDLNCYSEQTIRLPETYWCYQPGGPTPDVSPLPASRNGHVTFGCLNNFAKVSSVALDLWGQILRAIPGSRLLLFAPVGVARAKTSEQFARHGIELERLEFVAHQPWDQYIVTYNRIDIALDPLPFGGGISTCDALWMGVPVVSLSGGTAVGRSGRSILSNVGLSNLVALTHAQYVESAIDLAGDLPGLAAMRADLRDRTRRSPLMNAAAFARNVEAAYRKMWRAWCESAL